MSEENHIPESKKSQTRRAGIGLALYQFALLSYASVNVFFLTPEGRSSVLIRESDLIEGVSVLGYRILFWSFLALTVIGLIVLIFSIEQRPKWFAPVVFVLAISIVVAATLGIFEGAPVLQFALVVVAQALTVSASWIVSAATESPTEATIGVVLIEIPSRRTVSLLAVLVAIGALYCARKN